MLIIGSSTNQPHPPAGRGRGGTEKGRGMPRPQPTPPPFHGPPSIGRGGPFNYSPHPNGRPGFSNQAMMGGGDGSMVCMCGEEAILLTVRNEQSENKGTLQRVIHIVFIIINI